VNADVQVKADLDVPPPIHLAHPNQRYERWVTQSIPRPINKPTVGLLSSWGWREQ
jgi:hypothetical protein